MTVLHGLKQLHLTRWSSVTISKTFLHSNVRVNSRGLTLQKPCKVFAKTRRIPENPRGFQWNPSESLETPCFSLRWIPENPLESARILRSPLESPGIPRNPLESWESLEFVLQYYWKPRTKFSKCRAPRTEASVSQLLLQNKCEKQKYRYRSFICFRNKLKNVMIPIVLMRLIMRIQSILEKLATYQYLISFLYMNLFLYNCFFFYFFDMILFARVNSIISFSFYFCLVFFFFFFLLYSFFTENSYDTDNPP